MIYQLGGSIPLIGEDTWIAPSASVIGEVSLGRNVGIWFCAVLRGDNEPIIIGDETNVQENATLHTDMGFPLTIGARCTIGHNAIVHGCTIEDGCLVGMGAIVMNGVKLGEHSLVAAGALIPEGRKIPPRSLVVGSPGKVVRTLDEEEMERLEASAAHYAEAAKRFQMTLKAIS